MKYLTYIQIIICTLFCNVVISQIQEDVQNIMISTIPKEKIEIHINTDLLLTGETIFYNLFCLLKETNTASDISKIAYVEVIGEDNNTLFKHKLRLINGLSNGHFFIPANTKTGNYKLIGYTQWMKNNPKNLFFQKDIYIVNPYVENLNSPNNISKENDLAIIQVKNSEAEQLVNNKSQNIILKTDLEVYKTRSKVTLQINNFIGVAVNGNYSLSARKLDDIEIETKQNNDFNNNIINNNSFYLPELRGEVLSGYVISKKTDLVVENKIVALSIPGKNYVYKNVITDESGHFYFNIYENYVNSNVVLQVLDTNMEDFKIVLDDKSFKYVDDLKFKKIYLNENIKDWLVSKSISNQVENAYNTSKLDSIIYKSPAKAFYGKPTVTYNLDDYKRFSTVKETFIEVVEGAAIRKSKQAYSFKVFPREELDINLYSEFLPLVLVDGLLIQNNQYILDYSSYKIESISYVKEIQFYGPSVFSGIIDFRTKEKDFYLPSTTDGLSYYKLDIPLENKKYYNPNYDKNAEVLKRIPDYRHQLLWKPDVSIESNVKSIEFYTSDIEGVYEVILEGYTLNGNHLISKGYFEVKNN